MPYFKNQQYIHTSISRFSLIWVYTPILIIVAVYLINPVGSRFPNQDLMLNDLWATGRLDFFLDAFKNNLFSVINFSQGFGVDIRADIKTQIGIFDITLPLLLLVDPFNALTLKMAILLVLGYGSFYKLLNPKKDNFIKCHILSIIYVTSILFYSETSTLTTAAYSLTPLLLICIRNYKQRTSTNNLLVLALVSIYYAGNLDLNTIFIYPLIYLWCSDGKIRIMLSPAMLHVGILLVMSFLIIHSSSLLYLLSESPEIQKNSLSNVYFTNSGLSQLKNIFKSILIPYAAGPISLFTFPPLLAFLMARARSIKARNVFLCILFSTFLYCFPFLFPLIKEYIPSYIRYHFGILGILIYISTCQSALDHGTPPKNIFWSISLLVVVLIIIKGQSLILSLLVSIMFLLTCLMVFLDTHKITPKLHFMLPVFPILFIYIGFIGGFKHETMRVIDREYGRYYTQNLPKCINKFVGNRGFIPVANHKLFPDEGRHDLMLPLIERPALTGGRSFFQWRHSYPAVTANMYRLSNAHGSNDVNYFPPSKSAVDHEAFWSFVESSASSYIVSANIAINRPGWSIVGSCKAPKPLARSFSYPGYLNIVYPSFSDELIIYKKDGPLFNGIKYSPTQVEITPALFNTGVNINLPILFSPSLIIDSPVPVQIRENQGGFVHLEFENSKDLNTKVYLKSKDIFLYLPYFMLIPYLVCLYLISKFLTMRSK